MRQTAERSNRPAEFAALVRPSYQQTIAAARASRQPKPPPAATRPEPAAPSSSPSSSQSPTVKTCNYGALNRKRCADYSVFSAGSATQMMDAVAITTQNCREAVIGCRLRDKILRAAPDHHQILALSEVRWGKSGTGLEGVTRLDGSAIGSPAAAEGGESDSEAPPVSPLDVRDFITRGDGYIAVLGPGAGIAVRGGPVYEELSRLPEEELAKRFEVRARRVVGFFRGFTLFSAYAPADAKTGPVGDYLRNLVRYMRRTLRRTKRRDIPFVVAGDFSCHVGAQHSGFAFGDFACGRKETTNKGKEFHRVLTKNNLRFADSFFKIGMNNDERHTYQRPGQEAEIDGFATSGRFLGRVLDVSRCTDIRDGLSLRADGKYDLDHYGKTLKLAVARAADDQLPANRRKGGSNYVGPAPVTPDVVALFSQRIREQLDRPDSGGPDLQTLLSAMHVHEGTALETGQGRGFRKSARKKEMKKRAAECVPALAAEGGARPSGVRALWKHLSTNRRTKGPASSPLGWSEHYLTNVIAKSNPVCTFDASEFISPVSAASISALDRPITLVEWRQGLKEVKPGVDSMKWSKEVFDALDDHCTQLLLDAIDAELRSGRGLKAIDVMFRRTKITLLHKSGSRLDCDNFRGISMAPTLSKLVAHIMTKRLQEMTAMEGLADPENFGFVKGRNCSDGLVLFRRIVEDAKDFSEHEDQYSQVWAAFIDLRKAFPSLSLAVISSVMKELGIAGATTWRALDACRRDIVCCEDREQVDFSLPIGLQEGCPSSPGIFSLAYAVVSVSLRRARAQLQAKQDNLNPNGVRLRCPSSSFFAATEKEKLGAFFCPGSTVATAESVVGAVKCADDTNIVGESRTGAPDDDAMRVTLEALDAAQMGENLKKRITGPLAAEACKFLGVFFCDRRDFSARVSRAWRAYYSAQRLLVGFGELGKVHRRVVVSALVRSALIYGAHTRSFSAKEVAKLQPEENAILRRLCNTSTPQMDANNVSHSELRRHLGLSPLAAEISFARLSHGGHLLRRDSSYLPRQAFLGRFIVSSADPAVTPQSHPEQFLRPHCPYRVPGIYEQFLEACAEARTTVHQLPGFVHPDSRRDWYVRTRAWFVDAVLRDWFFAAWGDARAKSLEVSNAFAHLLAKYELSEVEFFQSYANLPRARSQRSTLTNTPELLALRAKQPHLGGAITDQQRSDLIEGSEGLSSAIRDGSPGILRRNSCEVPLSGSRRALAAHLSLHRNDPDDFARLVREQEAAVYIPAEEFLYGKAGQVITPQQYKQKQRLVIPPCRFIPAGTASKLSVSELRCPICTKHAVKWPRKYQQQVGASTRMKNHEAKCRARVGLRLQADDSDDDGGQDDADDSASDSPADAGE
ncbi:unnamed protein product [Amoebophrya sp. A120]|nr:unnamed protein product [Amoebophrya sp. A120]|eukprot:GSA120T00003957001.1